MVPKNAGVTISHLAREGGVGVETIRYYQRRGLLKVPPRAQAGNTKIRRYDEQDIRRLRFIRSAQAAGFTLEQIGELLELDATGDRPRARALAKEQIASLDAEIARLKTARNALKRLAEDCSHDTKGPCPILAAFEQTHK